MQQESPQPKLVLRKETLRLIQGGPISAETEPVRTTTSGFTCTSSPPPGAY